MLKQPGLAQFGWKGGTVAATNTATTTHIPAKCRTFDEEPFKRDASALALKAEKPRAQLTKELDVYLKSLGDWTRRYGRPAPLCSAAVPELELRTLRQENEHLRAHRDILIGVWHPCRTPAERFARMKPLADKYVLADLCAAFGVTRSSYHA